MSGDLSQFEQMSADTPKKIPYAIILGTLLIPIALAVVNWLVPNEAVDDLNKVGDAAEQAAEVVPAGGGGDDIDDI